jgi:hypothetical protein
MPMVLAVCGGFLLGVLWMDLLFDVQVLGAPSAADIASIATYYRRVTTEAYPLNRVIAGVMVIAVGGALYRVVAGRVPRARAAFVLLLAVVPTGLAMLRVVPNAVRLGAASDPPDVQAALAHAICIDHLICLVLMAAFAAVLIATPFGTKRNAPNSSL